MAVGTHGWFVFSCESEKGGTVYKARLHNPVQDIQKLAECVKGDRIRCKNDLMYYYGISSVLVYPIEKRYSPKFVIGSIQSKKTLTEKLKMANLSVDGTVASGNDRLLKYQKYIMKKYQQLGVEENFILLYNGKDVCRYHVNAITFLDHETMYVTFDSERIVAICSLTFNSVGIEANFSIVKAYDESSLKLYEIDVMTKKLIVSHNGSVSLINLESETLSAQFQAKYLAAYKDGFLFTSKHCINFWKTSGMELFAGQATEEGSRYGSVSYCRFYEATGFAVEFDNVYVCLFVLVLLNSKQN